MAASCSSAAGFALIESLVALAVLAVALAVLLQAAAGSARTLARAEQTSRATMQAESLLASVGTELPLLSGLTRGTLPQGGAWLVEIRPLPDGPAASAWRPMVVVVSIEAPDGRVAARLTTLRLAPP
jgi:general secretion pathway protein I